MNIWQILEGRELSQSKALKLFHSGKCVGLLSTKEDRGRVFNPIYNGHLNTTTIQDAKDDVRGHLGGAVEWYDLSDYKFDFTNPDAPAYQLPYTTFGSGNLNTARAQRIREFLFDADRKALVSISQVEQQAGIPANTLKFFLSGFRQLPDKHLSAIETVLSKVGYK